MSKINIGFIAPEKGIGGGNRKFKIIYDNLDRKYFNKYFIELNNNKDILNIKYLIKFIKNKKINIIYIGKKLKKSDINKIKKECTIIKNINFANLYDNDPNVLNFIISKTLFFKIKLIQRNMSNAYVTYNPIDIVKWSKLNTEIKENYIPLQISDKIIIGRLARSEPSKWSYLIINTIQKLDQTKNYNYIFIFAGMPKLHKFYLKIRCSKKMLKQIILIPELVTDKDITKFYKSIDIFWQASKAGETFGNVIAESFCFKKPVITDSKHFIKNKKCIMGVDNAQIELVDDNINGKYCNSPYEVIDFLESLTKNKIKEMGDKGNKKVREKYDVKHSSNTITKIIYDILLNKNKIKKSKIFKKLKIKPHKDELNKYNIEYIKRMKIVNNNNKDYKYLKYYQIWTIIEYMYLIIRKILNIIKIDIEKMGKNE